MGLAVLDGASHGVRNDSPSRCVGGFGQRLGGGKDIVIKVKGGSHEIIVSDENASDDFKGHNKDKNLALLVMMAMFSLAPPKILGWIFFRQHPPGIHQVLRVYRLLDAAHEL